MTLVSFRKGNDTQTPGETRTRRNTSNRSSVCASLASLPAVLPAGTDNRFVTALILINQRG